VGSSLLVGLGRSVVLLLLGLVGDGITGGLDTAEGVRIMQSESSECGYAYRSPMPALLSLATFLFASLEASCPAPWILSET